MSDKLQITKKFWGISMEVEVKGKKINVAEGLLYSKDHIWVKDGSDLTVGLSDYAVKELGNIETADMEDLKGQDIEVSSDPLMDARIESNKAIGDIFAPAAGKVNEVNSSLMDAPEKINDDPYGEGWLFKIKPSNWAADKANLMDAAKYADFLKKL
jgi:glycine cleavage system H protein